MLQYGPIIDVYLKDLLVYHLLSEYMEIQGEDKIMKDIYDLISDTAEQYVGDRDNLQAGANIAGFARVAEAMIMQGLV